MKKQVAWREKCDHQRYMFVKENTGKLKTINHQNGIYDDYYYELGWFDISISMCVCVTPTIKLSHTHTHTQETNIF